MSYYLNHTNIFKKTKFLFLKMQKITRKRTANEFEEDSKHLFKNNAKSLAQGFNNLRQSTKWVKGQRINNRQSHKSATNKKESNKTLVTDNSLDKWLREELEEDIYDRRNSSFTSESRLSSKYENEDEFWLVESDEKIMSSKEELKQNTSDRLTTKMQLFKTFIYKDILKNKIDQEKLIDPASKSNLYSLKWKLNEIWGLKGDQAQEEIKSLIQKLIRKLLI